MLTMTDFDPETIGHLLHDTARVWRTKLDQRLQPLGLSQAKWRTIAHLSGGHLTQCDLAQRLSIEEPTLARLLGEMEQDRWIKRVSSPHDRRCKTVQLQPKSSALLQQIEATARHLRHELLETIPSRDLQTCMRVLTDIQNRAAHVSNATMNGNGRSKNRGRAK